MLSQFNLHVLDKEILENHEVWIEDQIAQRSKEPTHSIINLWPGPEKPNQQRL